MVSNWSFNAALPRFTQQADRSLDAHRLDPFMLANDLADYLVRKGVSFRETHHISGQCVALSEQTSTPMDQLTVEQLQTIDPHIGPDIVAVFDYKKSVEMRNTKGDTSRACVLEQIAILKDWSSSISSSSVESHMTKPSQWNKSGANAIISNLLLATNAFSARLRDTIPLLIHPLHSFAAPTMAAGLDVERLSLAFQSRPDLVDGIQRAADSPARVALFNSIAGFVYDQLCTDEPALKRRKVDGPVQGGSTNGGLPTRNAAAAGATGGAAADAVAAGTEPVLLEIKDISLSIPQRKKFDLCFTKHHLYARPPGTTAPVQGLVWAWKDIEYVFCVPVPEKTQLQHNYVVFPRGTALASAYKPPQTPACEPLMFTVPATAPKPGSVSGPSAQLAASVSDAYSTLLDWALAAQLQSAGNASAARIVKTDAKVFHSVVRQAHRPSEQAVHVRAFRGSKDGYLFFLPTGILWGFKKPLLFVPLDRIAAVSYTNVLQRTFNVAIEVDLGGSDSNGDGEATTVEIEFGMLDHADYGGIDETYVRRHGLQDRSMAEQRKAKRELAENAPKAEGGGGTRRGGDEEMDGLVDDSAAADGPTAAANGGEDDGLTELQRAEMQLQDEEDELEEDYDPGSDGDSDGSGASSDEEDGEGEEGEDDDDDDDDDGGDE